MRTNRTLTLLVINKSASSTLTANFNLSGYVPYGNAAIYSYGIPQDEAARTGVGSPDMRIPISWGRDQLLCHVRSVLRHGDGDESWPTSPPVTPTSLVASRSNAVASLSWIGSAGADSYLVKRSTTSGSGYTNIATGLTTTSFTDTGLVNGTTYYYVVAATNVYGVSPDSAEARQHRWSQCLHPGRRRTSARWELSAVRFTPTKCSLCLGPERTFKALPMRSGSII